MESEWLIGYNFIFTVDVVLSAFIMAHNVM